MNDEDDDEFEDDWDDDDEFLSHGDMWDEFADPDEYCHECDSYICDCWERD